MTMVRPMSWSARRHTIEDRSIGACAEHEGTRIRRIKRARLQHGSHSAMQGLALKEGARMACLQILRQCEQVDRGCRGHTRHCSGLDRHALQGGEDSCGGRRSVSDITSVKRLCDVTPSPHLPGRRQQQMTSSKETIHFPRFRPVATPGRRLTHVDILTASLPQAVHHVKHRPAPVRPRHADRHSKRSPVPSASPLAASALNVAYQSRTSTTLAPRLVSWHVFAGFNTGLGT